MGGKRRGDSRRIQSFAIVPLKLTVPYSTEPVSTYDFEIDGQLLSKRLGIDRTHFRSIRSGLGGVHVPESYHSYLDQLDGQTPAFNQFGSGRLVLFGCCCGCDYCGIVSCRVTVHGDSIEWSDIRGEDYAMDLRPIGPLRLSRENLVAEIRRLRKLVRRRTAQLTTPLRDELR